MGSKTIFSYGILRLCLKHKTALPLVLFFILFFSYITTFGAEGGVLVQPAPGMPPPPASEPLAAPPKAPPLPEIKPDQPGLFTALDGKRMSTVQTPQHAVAEFNSFNIAKDHSYTLTHLAGRDASTTIRVDAASGVSNIEGLFKVNGGNVFFLNPNGLLIGESGIIDMRNAGHFVASTHDHIEAGTNPDGSAFVHLQDLTNPSASIVNRGNILLGESGVAVLSAPTLQNYGGILGHAVFAAGDSTKVTFDGLVHFEVDGATEKLLVENKGRIGGEGKHVVLATADAEDFLGSQINMTGELQGKTITVLGGENSTVTLGPQSKTDATGQKGGEVRVLGDHLHIKATPDHGAFIDASGQEGGGLILVGGNKRGKGPEKNAHTLIVDDGVQMNADAALSGSGGTIVNYADQWSSNWGRFSASSLSRNDRAGELEISAPHLRLAQDADHVPRMWSLLGKPGHVIIDPVNVNILDTLPAGHEDPAGNDPGDKTYLSKAWVEGVLNASTDLTIDATTKITVENSILSTASNSSFTLDSDTVYLNDTVSIKKGPINSTIYLKGNEININGLNADPDQDFYGYRLYAEALNFGLYSGNPNRREMWLGGKVLSHVVSTRSADVDPSIISAHGAAHLTVYNVQAEFHTLEDATETEDTSIFKALQYDADSIAMTIDRGTAKLITDRLGVGTPVNVATNGYGILMIKEDIILKERTDISADEIPDLWLDAPVIRFYDKSDVRLGPKTNPTLHVWGHTIQFPDDAGDNNYGYRLYSHTVDFKLDGGGAGNPTIQAYGNRLLAHRMKNNGTDDNTSKPVFNNIGNVSNAELHTLWERDDKTESELESISYVNNANPDLTINSKNAPIIEELLGTDRGVRLFADGSSSNIIITAPISQTEPGGSLRLSTNKIVVKDDGGIRLGPSDIHTLHLWAKIIDFQDHPAAGLTTGYRIHTKKLDIKIASGGSHIYLNGPSILMHRGQNQGANTHPGLPELTAGHVFHNQGNGEIHTLYFNDTDNQPITYKSEDYTGSGTTNFTINKGISDIIKEQLDLDRRLNIEASGKIDINHSIIHGDSAAMQNLTFKAPTINMAEGTSILYEKAGSTPTVTFLGNTVSLNTDAEDGKDYKVKTGTINFYMRDDVEAGANFYLNANKPLIAANTLRIFDQDYGGLTIHDLSAETIRQSTQVSLSGLTYSLNHPLEVDLSTPVASDALTQITLQDVVLTNDVTIKGESTDNRLYIQTFYNPSGNVTFNVGRNFIIDKAKLDYFSLVNQGTTTITDSILVPPGDPEGEGSLALDHNINKGNTNGTFSFNGGLEIDSAQSNVHFGGASVTLGGGLKSLGGEEGVARASMVIASNLTAKWVDLTAYNGATDNVRITSDGSITVTELDTGDSAIAPGVVLQGYATIDGPITAPRIYLRAEETNKGYFEINAKLTATGLPTTTAQGQEYDEALLLQGSYLHQNDDQIGGNPQIYTPEYRFGPNAELSTVGATGDVKSIRIGSRISQTNLMNKPSGVVQGNLNITSDDLIFLENTTTQVNLQANNGRPTGTLVIQESSHTPDDPGNVTLHRFAQFSRYYSYIFGGERMRYMSSQAVEDDSVAGLYAPQTLSISGTNITLDTQVRSPAEIETFDGNNYNNYNLVIAARRNLTIGPNAHIRPTQRTLGDNPTQLQVSLMAGSMGDAGGDVDPATDSTGITFEGIVEGYGPINITRAKWDEATDLPVVDIADTNSMPILKGQRGPSIGPAYMHALGDNGSLNINVNRMTGTHCYVDAPDGGTVNLIQRQTTLAVDSDDIVSINASGAGTLIIPNPGGNNNIVGDEGVLILGGKLPQGSFPYLKISKPGGYTTLMSNLVSTNNGVDSAEYDYDVHLLAGSFVDTELTTKRNMYFKSIDGVVKVDDGISTINAANIIFDTANSDSWTYFTVQDNTVLKTPNPILVRNLGKTQLTFKDMTLGNARTQRLTFNSPVRMHNVVFQPADGSTFTEIRVADITSPGTLEIHDFDTYYLPMIDKITSGTTIAQGSVGGTLKLTYGNGTTAFDLEKITDTALRNIEIRSAGGVADDATLTLSNAPSVERLGSITVFPGIHHEEQTLRITSTAEDTELIVNYAGGRIEFPENLEKELTFAGLVLNPDTVSTTYFKIPAEHTVKTTEWVLNLGGGRDGSGEGQNGNPFADAGHGVITEISSKSTLSSSNDSNNNTLALGYVRFLDATDSVNFTADSLWWTYGVKAAETRASVGIDDAANNIDPTKVKELLLETTSATNGDINITGWDVDNVLKTTKLDIIGKNNIAIDMKTEAYALEGVTPSIRFKNRQGIIFRVAGTYGGETAETRPATIDFDLARHAGTGYSNFPAIVRATDTVTFNLGHYTAPTGDGVNQFVQIDSHIIAPNVALTNPHATAVAFNGGMGTADERVTKLTIADDVAADIYFSNSKFYFEADTTIKTAGSLIVSEATGEALIDAPSLTLEAGNFITLASLTNDYDAKTLINTTAGDLTLKAGSIIQSQNAEGTHILSATGKIVLDAGQNSTINHILDSPNVELKGAVDYTLAGTRVGKVAEEERGHITLTNPGEGHITLTFGETTKAYFESLNLTSSGNLTVKGTLGEGDVLSTEMYLKTSGSLTAPGDITLKDFNVFQVPTLTITPQATSGTQDINVTGNLNTNSLTIKAADPAHYQYHAIDLGTTVTGIGDTKPSLHLYANDFTLAQDLIDLDSLTIHTITDMTLSKSIHAETALSLTSDGNITFDGGNAHTLRVDNDNATITAGGNLTLGTKIIAGDTVTLNLIANGLLTLKENIGDGVNTPEKLILTGLNGIVDVYGEIGNPTLRATEIEMKTNEGIHLTTNLANDGAVEKFTAEARFIELWSQYFHVTDSATLTSTGTDGSGRGITVLRAPGQNLSTHWQVGELNMTAESGGRIYFVPRVTSLNTEKPITLTTTGGGDVMFTNETVNDGYGWNVGPFTVNSSGNVTSLRLITSLDNTKPITMIGNSLYLDDPIGYTNVGADASPSTLNLTGVSSIRLRNKIKANTVNVNVTGGGSGHYVKFETADATVDSPNSSYTVVGNGYLTFDHPTDFAGTHSFSAKNITLNASIGADDPARRGTLTFTPTGTFSITGGNAIYANSLTIDDGATTLYGTLDTVNLLDLTGTSLSLTGDSTIRVGAAGTFTTDMQIDGGTGYDLALEVPNTSFKEVGGDYPSLNSILQGNFQDFTVSAKDIRLQNWSGINIQGELGIDSRGTTDITGTINVHHSVTSVGNMRFHDRVSVTSDTPITFKSTTGNITFDLGVDTNTSLIIDASGHVYIKDVSNPITNPAYTGPPLTASFGTLDAPIPGTLDIVAKVLHLEQDIYARDNITLNPADGAAVLDVLVYANGAPKRKILSTTGEVIAHSDVRFDNNPGDSSSLYIGSVDASKAPFNITHFQKGDISRVEAPNGFLLDGTVDMSARTEDLAIGSAADDEDTGDLYLKDSADGSNHAFLKMKHNLTVHGDLIALDPDLDITFDTTIDGAVKTLTFQGALGHGDHQLPRDIMFKSGEKVEIGGTIHANRNITFHTPHVYLMHNTDIHLENGTIKGNDPHSNRMPHFNSLNDDNAYDLTIDVPGEVLLKHMGGTHRLGAIDIHSRGSYINVNGGDIHGSSLRLKAGGGNIIFAGGSIDVTGDRTFDTTGQIGGWSALHADGGGITKIITPVGAGVTTLPPIGHNDRVGGFDASEAHGGIKLSNSGIKSHGLIHLPENTDFSSGANLYSDGIGGDITIEASLVNNIFASLWKGNITFTKDVSIAQGVNLVGHITVQGAGNGIHFASTGDYGTTFNAEATTNTASVTAPGRIKFGGSVNAWPAVVGGPTGTLILDTDAHVDFNLAKEAKASEANNVNFDIRARGLGSNFPHFDRLGLLKISAAGDWHVQNFGAQTLDLESIGGKLLINHDLTTINGLRMRSEVEIQKDSDMLFRNLMGTMQFDSDIRWEEGDAPHDLILEQHGGGSMKLHLKESTNPSENIIVTGNATLSGFINTPGTITFNDPVTLDGNLTLKADTVHAQDTMSGSAYTLDLRNVDTLNLAQSIGPFNVVDLSLKHISNKTVTGNTVIARDLPIHGPVPTYINALHTLKLPFTSANGISIEAREQSPLGSYNFLLTNVLASSHIKKIKELHIGDPENRGIMHLQGAMPIADVKVYLHGNPIVVHGDAYLITSDGQLFLHPNARLTKSPEQRNLMALINEHVSDAHQNPMEAIVNNLMLVEQQALEIEPLETEQIYNLDHVNLDPSLMLDDAMEMDTSLDIQDTPTLEPKQDPLMDLEESLVGTSEGEDMMSMTFDGDLDGQEDDLEEEKDEEAEKSLKVIPEEIKAEAQEMRMVAPTAAAA